LKKSHTCLLVESIISSITKINAGKVTFRDNLKGKIIGVDNIEGKVFSLNRKDVSLE
jgi:hypothetical protein